MERAGFQKLAEVSYELMSEIWWHPEKLMQVSIVIVYPYYLLKASKGYLMKAITEEGFYQLPKLKDQSESGIIYVDNTDLIIQGNSNNYF